MHEPPEPPELPRGWVVPAVGALVQLVTGLLLLRVGIHYDAVARAPGALTWLAVSLLTAPWLIAARRQWRREQVWLQQQEAERASMPELRIAAQLQPLIQRHGLTAVIDATEQLADERRALMRGPDDRR